MGIDSARFTGPVDKDLTCPICSDILEDAVQRPDCEHVYCRSCITDWLENHDSCPDCRGALSIEALKEPRIVRNLLGRLEIHCDFQERGCHHVTSLDSLKDHLANCRYNPDLYKTCDHCTLEYYTIDDPPHNCVRELRNMMSTVEITMHSLADAVYETKAIASSLNDAYVVLQTKVEEDLDVIKREHNLLKAMVLELRSEKEQSLQGRTNVPAREKTRKLAPAELITDAAPPRSNVFVQALSSREPKREDELAFEKGDVFEFLQETEDAGWCVGKKSSKVGYFPIGLVEIVQK